MDKLIHFSKLKTEFLTLPSWKTFLKRQYRKIDCNEYLLTLKTIRDLPDKIFDETINRKQGGIVESQFGLDSRQRDRRRGGVGRKASHLRRGRAHGGAARPRARRVRSDLAAESAPRATAPHNTSAGTSGAPGTRLHRRRSRSVHTTRAEPRTDPSPNAASIDRGVAPAPRSFQRNATLASHVQHEKR